MYISFIAIMLFLQLEKRRSAVLKSLSDFFGPEVYQYMDYQDKVWDTEPYNEGAPISCVAPGAMRYYATGLRQPFNRYTETSLSGGQRI